MSRWAGAIAGWVAVVALGMSGPVMALDKVTFGTNWKAQAEHGGYYQAVADGTYAKYGLDVTIRPGRTAGQPLQLLAAGKIDFNMGGNLFEPVQLHPEQRADGDQWPPSSRRSRRSCSPTPTRA